MRQHSADPQALPKYKAAGFARTQRLRGAWSVVRAVAQPTSAMRAAVFEAACLEEGGGGGLTIWTGHRFGIL